MLRLASRNVYTHFPKDTNCEVRQKCKIMRAQRRNKLAGKADDLPQLKASADSITIDHAILIEDDKSVTKSS